MIVFVTAQSVPAAWIVVRISPPSDDVEYTYSVRAPSSPILHARRPAQSYPVEDDTKSDPAKRVSLVTFPNKSYILNVVMPLRVVVTCRPSASYE